MFKKYFKDLWKYNKKQRQNYLLKLAYSHKDKISTYLDLGCDDGGFTKQIAKATNAKKVYGIEINHKRAVLATKKGITISETNLNTPLPFGDNYFDLITADQVIEHLIDVDIFVSEIKRVLKPGGSAIVGTENLGSFHNIFALIIGIQPFSGPNISRKYRVCHHPIGPKSAKECLYEVDSMDLEDHKRVMTYKVLVSLFEFYGFNNIVGSGFGYIPLPSFLGNLLAKVDKSHSQFILIEAEK